MFGNGLIGIKGNKIQKDQKKPELPPSNYFQRLHRHWRQLLVDSRNPLMIFTPVCVCVRVVLHGHLCWCGKLTHKEKQQRKRATSVTAAPLFWGKIKEIGGKQSLKKKKNQETSHTLDVNELLLLYFRSPFSSFQSEYREHPVNNCSSGGSWDVFKKDMTSDRNRCWRHLPKIRPLLTNENIL